MLINQAISYIKNISCNIGLDFSDLKQAACASGNPSTETSQNYRVPEDGCTENTILASEAADESKQTNLGSARYFMEASWKNTQRAK